MSKTKNFKEPARTRYGTPTITRDKDGTAILNCPFCAPTHPIRPNIASVCGTMLEVRAVQRVYRAKYEKGMVCVKCGQGGGEMVLFQNGFIHTYDCKPGVVALANPPKFSRLADAAHKAPPSVRKMIEGVMGDIVPVYEVNPDGTKTGVTLGYFFKRGKHAKRKTTQPAGSVS